MEIIKIDDNQIEVTKTETKETKNTFNYEYLVSQKKDIQEHKDRDNEQRDKELAEINILLEECNKLGVTIKVEEPIEPIEIIKE